MKQTTPLFQSLTKPILIFGGERENIILLSMVSLSLWIVGRDFWSFLIGLVIGCVGLVISKVVAKIDPLATKIFMRSSNYQDFYPARERINTPKSIIKRKRKF